MVKFPDDVGVNVFPATPVPLHVPPDWSAVSATLCPMQIAAVELVMVGEFCLMLSTADVPVPSQFWQL